MITVRLFALLREKAGAGELAVTGRPATIRDLLVLLERDLPALRGMLSEGRLLVSVNQELATVESALRDGDEVGLMPPFSGGQELHGTVRIQREAFSVDEEVRKIKRASSSIGGIAVFVGATRDQSRGRTVASLEFEHYPGMAERKLAEIRERAIGQQGIIDATIIHRVGRLPPGEDIVLIVAAAEHRDEAFRACRFCIDELKRMTPIWKKETTPDGEVWVEEHP